MNVLETLRRNLRGGLFLSSMMHVTDGSFCSERCEGCVMVQTGAYLAEPPAYCQNKAVLPPDKEKCLKFFIIDCGEARNRQKVTVCFNLASPKLEWGLEAAELFHKAGGDIVELNIHGSYEPYFRLGKLRAMVLPENRHELFRWLEIFSRIDVPLIVKFREGVIPDYTPVLDKVADYGFLGVHFNVRDDATKKPDFDFIKEIKKKYSLFLLASGNVRAAEDAKRLFEAGADMVGIAEPTIMDRKFISKIAEELKKIGRKR